MKLPTHISYVLKKSFYLLSWKSLSCMKFQKWKYFPNEIKMFSTPLVILNKWKKSCHLLSRVSWWKEFEFMRIRKENESLGKSFYSLSFNFQKVSNLTQFHIAHHTSNQNYLFNITFQNLEFWDVINLPPLKWISSSRFREASKK